MSKKRKAFAEALAKTCDPLIAMQEAGFTPNRGSAHNFLSRADVQKIVEPELRRRVPELLREAAERIEQGGGESSALLSLGRKARELL